MMETTRALKERYDAYLFDIDGTLLMGDDPLPGAVEVLTRLARHGVPFAVVSNNATHAPAEYAQRLRRSGVEIADEAVVTSLVATVEWLAGRGLVVYPIAPRPLVDALARAGVEMSEDPRRIDVVVASYDREFSYAKLQVAFDALWFYKRAFLIATNPDVYCPYPGGRGEPDCAAIVAAIERSTGVKCRRWFGKPDPAMVRAALAHLDVDSSRVLMVGDRLTTDIACARAAGIDSALVLTGDSTPRDIERLGIAPTWVIEDVGALAGAFD